jgi:hypothetical protein
MYTHESSSFPIWVRGGKGRAARMEFLNSCVPIMFSYVARILNRLLTMFPKFSMCSSKVSPIALHFIPYLLPNVLAKLETYYPHIEIVILESISSFNYYFYYYYYLPQANQNCPLQKIEKRKHKTWEAAHLMNKRDFWKMKFWLVLKLEISYKVIIS